MILPGGNQPIRPEEKEDSKSEIKPTQTRGKERISRDKNWVNYSFATKQEKTIYKLHIFINPAEFDKTKEALTNILKDAVEQKHIESFKYLSAAGVRNTSEKNRLKQMPYAIYLTNLHEYSKDNFKVIQNYLGFIVQLCKKIESVLLTTDAGDEKTLAICDLPVSRHIRFRLASDTKDDYVEVRDAAPAVLENLKQRGKQSRRYQFLLENLKEIEDRYNSCKEQATRIVQEFCGEKNVITNKDEIIKDVEKFLLTRNDIVDGAVILKHLKFTKVSSKGFLCFSYDIGKLEFKQPDETPIQDYSVSPQR